MDGGEAEEGVVGEVGDELDAEVGEERGGGPGGHEEEGGGGGRRECVGVAERGLEGGGEGREGGSEVVDEGFVGEDRTDSSGVYEYGGRRYHGGGGH